MIRLARLALTTAVVMLVAARGAFAAETLSVQVRSADVRTTPSFLATVAGALAYGQRVAVDERSGSWVRVRTEDGRLTGWVHNSALTRSVVTLRPGETPAQAASSGELALAGKGFNADVEKQFRAANRNVDFSWVDRMERQAVPPARLAAFLAEGGLATGGHP